MAGSGSRGVHLTYSITDSMYPSLTGSWDRVLTAMMELRNAEGEELMQVMDGIDLKWPSYLPLRIGG